MSLNGMYCQITQEYLYYKNEKMILMQERDKVNAQIDAKIEVIEEILKDLNDILCKYGNHIYEHFEEKEEKDECRSCETTSLTQCVE